MRSISRLLLLTIAAGGVVCQRVHATDPGQESFTEGFDNGSNAGRWNFRSPGKETLETEGGNPDAFYLGTDLATNGADVSTTLGVESPFVGDFRARGVVSVGVDVAVLWGNELFPKAGYAVYLENDAGTPADPMDNCWVWLVAPKPAPQARGRWRWVSYEFRIPSSSQTLPSHWGATFCQGLTADQAWNRVITAVDRLMFIVLPEVGVSGARWTLGIDNPRITWSTSNPD